MDPRPTSRPGALAGDGDGIAGDGAADGTEDEEEAWPPANLTCCSRCRVIGPPVEVLGRR